MWCITRCNSTAGVDLLITVDTDSTTENLSLSWSLIDSFALHTVYLQYFEDLMTDIEQQTVFIMATVGELDVITEDITPEIFYDKYVLKRTPCAFRHTRIDDQWHGDRWNNSYLQEHCGNYNVKVEKRQTASDTYGRGNEIVMKFGDFLTVLESGNDETLYLTTQDLKYRTDGRPLIYSPPIDGLLGDFPTRPTLCGNLIPQNVNLWMGYSRIPSSSRLHHDFHDNMYILLRGKKKFILYHPQEAKNLYTVGKIVKIHNNGRINYEGQRMTKDDGSDEGAEAALLASIQLEEATKRLLMAEEEGVECDEAEDDIDKALQAMLDAETAGDDYDDDAGDDVDDDDDINAGIENGDDDDDDEYDITEELRECEDHDDDNAVAGEKRRASDSSSSSSSVSEQQARKKMKCDPMNFSRVDTSLSDDMLASQFPLYLEARSRRIEVTVEAGEMLFIPAGWFHEVQSSNSDLSNGHMAFNYWFHPAAGATNGSAASFNHPYSSDFWSKEWLKHHE